MPVFEPLDDATDRGVSKDKASLKTTRWGRRHVTIPHALRRLCLADRSETHAEEYGNWRIAGSSAVLTVNPVQESGDATIITCNAGCNVILEAALDMLETTRLIKTVARRSLIEVSQRGGLTSPGGAASLCPHYFEDVIYTQQIMREDR